MSVATTDWRAVHEDQIATVIEIIDEVRTITDGVIATGLTWKLENAVAHLNSWDHQVGEGPVES